MTQLWRQIRCRMREVRLRLRIASRTRTRVVVAHRRRACGIGLALDRVAPAVVCAGVAVVCGGCCCGRIGGYVSRHFRRCIGWYIGRCFRWRVSGHVSGRIGRIGSRRGRRCARRICRRLAQVTQLRRQIRCRMREVRLRLRVASRTRARVVVAHCRRACRMGLALDRVAPAPVRASIAVMRGRGCGRRGSRRRSRR